MAFSLPWLLVLLRPLASTSLEGIQWPWLHSSGQRGYDVGDAAADCSGDPLGLWEVVHQAGGTCAGAMGYREYF